MSSSFSPISKNNTSKWKYHHGTSCNISQFSEHKIFHSISVVFGSSPNYSVRHEPFSMFPRPTSVVLQFQFETLFLSKMPIYYLPIAATLGAILIERFMILPGYTGYSHGPRH